MKREDLVPEELDVRLREWGRFFKDRRKWETAKSLEGRFNPHSPGSWDTGWGDPGVPQAILPPILVPRVLLTHEAVQSLQKPGKWAVTYSYCYPSLQRYRILKLMKKYTGRRFTWNAYLDTLEIARIKVWARIR